MFRERRSSKTDGDEILSVSIAEKDFYKFLGSTIKEDNNISRTVGNFQFVFSVGGDDLSTYMMVNEPSTGIVQEKPSFSNINGAVGIFSTRFINNKIYKQPSSKLKDSIIYGQYTKNLGFGI